MTPVDYILYDAYPNPFNPITNIVYHLPKKMMVEIIIYDILGNFITKFVKQGEGPGQYSVQWNGTNHTGQGVSAGVYLYKIQAEDFVDTKKMILLK